MRDAETAREIAARAGLSPSVRALGSAVRSMGRAEASRESGMAIAARRELESAVAALVNEPPEGILALRALQTATFIRAVRDLETTGVASRDVSELGGGLVSAFRDAGWTLDEGGRTRLAMNDDELGAAYRKRWNQLVSLRKEVGGTTLTEEKLLFAFAVRHMRGAATSAVAGTERVIGSRTMLKRIDEYARLDPEYPADFARGIAHFGALGYANAQVAFDRHLTAHPDGPLTLRARNFARAALIADADPGALGP